MRNVLDVLLEIVVALATAIGLATLLVGGAVFGLGCALFGGSWCWRRWRGGRARRANGGDRPRH